jgi:hypothetical protein
MFATPAMPVMATHDAPNANLVILDFIVFSCGLIVVLTANVLLLTPELLLPGKSLQLA